jgi:hypothetical protein
MTDGRLGEAGVGGEARGATEAVAIRVHHDGGDSVCDLVAALSLRSALVMSDRSVIVFTTSCKWSRRSRLFFDKRASMSAARWWRLHEADTEIIEVGLIGNGSHSLAGELFGLEYDLLLYDATSTFFGGAAEGNP